MMTPSPGEIWLADIPFTDGSASKIRPVLVLWLDAGARGGCSSDFGCNAFSQ
jgi:mRNA-degrading endonuclease toxin of MazEF toxin-antitoxin module